MTHDQQQWMATQCDTCGPLFFTASHHHDKAKCESCREIVPVLAVAQPDEATWRQSRVRAFHSGHCINGYFTADG